MSAKEVTIGSYQLEICSNSPYSALQAQEGGATRVELCQNLENGGTTPSYGQIRLARELLRIGVHVLIRPRGGDFVYSASEFAEMLFDIEICKKLGVDGVVIGILHADGTVDRERTAQLVQAARPMCVTFHRAFDCCPEPFGALDDLISLGIDRILTSGLRSTALEGLDTLTRLVEHAAGRIVVMPGSGISSDNIEQILLRSKAIAVHSSAKVVKKTSMLQPENNVGMNEDQFQTSREKVHQMADLLKALSHKSTL